MSAYTIVANVGTSMATATGRPGQGHLVYASQTGLGNWWLFYLSSTASLSAVTSSDFSSWAGPSSGSPMSLAQGHNSEGRNFAFSYQYNATYTEQIVHMVSTYLISGNTYTYHSRFTLGSTWTQTNSEASTGTNYTQGDYTFESGCVTTLDSSFYPVDVSPYWAISKHVNGEQEIAIASNSDTGTTWTSGFGTPAGIGSLGSYITSNAIFSLGSRNLIVISDNGVVPPSGGSFSNLQWATWNGSSLSSASNVFGSALTTTDANAWGAVARTTSDIHVVALSDNSSNYTHYRFNGTSWSAGNTIPSLAYGTNSGIFLATDGTSVWAFAIDTSHTVQFTQWNGSAWSAWSDAAINSSAATYLSGCQQVQSGSIGLVWTLADGSNYDIAGTLFNTVPGFPVGAISCSVP